MLETGWSWPEYCALPDGYVTVLTRMLNERAAAARRAAARPPRRR